MPSKAPSTRSMKTAQAASAQAAYTPMPPERYHVQRDAVQMIPDELVRHTPSRLPERIVWMTRFLDAARRATPDLCRVPMDPDPDLSDAELSDLSERVDFLRQVDEELRSARKNPTPPEIAARIGEARELQAAVLDGLEFLFRKDAKVLRQLRELRHGDGLADLMEDASHLWSFWQTHKALCKRLIKGEGHKLVQLVELTNELSQLSSQIPQARDLRALRDRAYTWALVPIERIREAAAYLFSDQPDRLAEFALFSPIQRRTRKDAPRPHPHPHKDPKKSA